MKQEERIMKKKLLALLLTSAMVVSLAACGDKGGVETDSTQTGSSQATPTQSGSETVEATYTLNDYLEASPTNWNPHTWETNADSFLQDYQAEMGFVDVTIAEDGVTYEWVYEMADAIEDITATYEDREKWGITEEEGRVFRIDLNQAACWEDGTPINADTYIYSMQKAIDPEMKNYRANSYTESSVALMNALNYYNNDKAGQAIYASIYDGADYVLGVDETDKMFVSMTEANVFWGMSLNDAYASYGAAYFTGADGTDYYTVLAGLVGDAEFAPMTDEMKAAIEGICSVVGGGYPEEFMEMAFYDTGVVREETPWDEVGLIKTGDYQLIYITELPCDMFDFLTNMTGNWIVYEDLYEAGMQTIEGLKATNYGTSVDTYKSFGPYKLTSFEVDKQFILERNENWYGYSDGKHEGQYQTTTIKIDVVGDHNTALQLFNSGKLDSVTLTADDMTTYRMSDYLMKTDQTYTFRWIFGTSLETLKALEEQANDGANKRVLYYDDFRKAISLSMDRNRLTTEATSGYKPAYYLFNYLYYTNIANDPESQYRRTPEAMKAVCDIYNLEYTDENLEEVFNSITGYDVESAKALFQSVYEQAIADGNYTDGQEIHINCMATASASLSAEDVAQQDLMNEFVAAATVGTGFEGKITFTFQAGSQNRYEDVVNGTVEMIRGAWGGAAFYPYSTIRCYTEPDYMGGLAAIHESNGWNPTIETLDITYDFDGDGTAETVTDTFQNWAKSVNGGGAYANDPAAATMIMSRLEYGVISAYQCIPWAAQTNVSMHSQQIDYYTYDYNIMYGYGGTRLLKFNYSDAEWDEYVASQGGTLSYE